MSEDTRYRTTALRIGLVSDTHVPKSLPQLPGELLERLAGVDRILHAGDLVDLDVLQTLERIAPTTAVVGNMDPPEVVKSLPETAVLELGGRRIGLKHGHQRHDLQRQYIGKPYDAPEFDLFFQAMATQLPDCGIIVFGHFHAPLVRRWNDILFINPGAIAPPHQGPTYALLTLGDPVDVAIRPL
jgi:uncharacterized protein